MTTSYGVILVIALYMPVDYGDDDALNEYIMELGFLEGTLEIVQYDHVLLLGDFNNDLRYISSFSGRLESFLLEHSFSAVDLGILMQAA